MPCLIKEESQGFHALKVKRKAGSHVFTQTRVGSVVVKVKWKRLCESNEKAPHQDLAKSSFRGNVLKTQAWNVILVNQKRWVEK